MTATAKEGQPQRSRLRQLLGDTAVYGMSSVLSRFASFFLVPIYVRAFAPEEYGVIGIIAAIYSVMGLISILGIDNSVFRFYYDTEDEPDRRSTIYSWIAFQVFASFAVSGAMWLLSEPLARTFLRGAHDAHLMRLLSATLLLEALTPVANVVLRIERKPWQIVTRNAGRTILRALLTIVFVLTLDMGADGAVLAMLWAALPFAISNYVQLRRWIVQSQYSSSRLQQLLRFGVPAAPATFAVWAIQSSDRLVLEHFSGLADVGRYTLAAALASVMAFGLSAFRQAWVPFAMSIRNEGGSREVYAAVFKYFVAVMAFVTAGVALFADDLVRAVASRASNYGEVGAVVAVLGFAWVAHGIYQIAYRGVINSGKTIHIGWTTTLAAALNLGLSFVLIPVIGVMGAALANVIAQSISAGLLMVQSQRHDPAPFDWGLCAVSVITSAVTIAIGLALPIDGLWPRLAARAALLVIQVVILHLLGVIPTKAIAARLLSRRRGAAGAPDGAEPQVPHV